MVYTDRKIAMSSPDNDHEGDVAQEKNSAKEPFQEGESLTEAQKNCPRSENAWLGDSLSR